MRSSKPISVTLGVMRDSIDKRLQSGDYDSASEILRAALRALDREDAAVTQHLRASIATSLADPRPSISAADVFKQLRGMHTRRSKVAKR